MSNIRKKERSNSKSDFKDQTVKMVDKRIKMHDLQVHILIKNGAEQQLIVVFSILPPLFHKLCVFELPSPHLVAFLSHYTYICN